MNDELTRLYRCLGYSGPLATETSRSLAGAAVAVRKDPAELPPLDAAGLDEFEDQLNREPEWTLSRVRETWDADLTEAELRSSLAYARRALTSPREAVAMLEAETTLLRSTAPALPPEFNFPGMNLSEIPINPEDRKFEDDDVAGILGWIIGAGPFFLTRPSRRNFRFHDHPQHSSRFIYPLEEPSPDSPLEIALFSDFGTGRYYSKYIARQLHSRRFPYAIHLGDVYYAGRRSEFAEYFEALLDPMLGDTSLFTLNSNHEMFSAGIPYFDYISRRAQLEPGRQKQEGSYFCLRSERFQVVGIDTAFFGHGRYREPVLLEWLQNVLREGRQAGCVNILLSADHPYEYREDEITDLLRKDLAVPVLSEQLVDLWFWGNTHYCALFNHQRVAAGRIPALPFVGSCIGHGGFPYDTKRRGGFEPAPLLFLEENARFPKWTGLRQDKGNNGYCVLQLKADGSLGLQYMDWMSNRRFAATLSRESGDNLLQVTPLGF
jgi:hypothetical protein